MRKFFFIVLMCVLTMNGYSQTTSSSNVSSKTTLDKISEQLDNIEYRIRGLDRYKLYPTENIYNFLKLDTATGRIQQVQWSLDKDNEGSVIINSEDLSYNTGCGTFELYPTKNIYQFLLLDKVNGRQWHVQWGMESGQRWIKRID